MRLVLQFVLMFVNLALVSLSCHIQHRYVELTRTDNARLEAAKAAVDEANSRLRDLERKLEITKQACEDPEDIHPVVYR